jgi:hypothetical protein
MADDEAHVRARAQCEEASTLEQNGAPGLIRLSKKAAKRLMKETLREGTCVDKRNFDLLPTYVSNFSALWCK